MRIENTIAAFAQRGARRGTAAGLLLYSALVALALITLAALIVPAMRESDQATRAFLSQPGYLGRWPDPAEWTTLALADVLACLLLGFGGFIAAPALVTAAVAMERRQGTLDQLRTTPLSPLGLALGVIAGVPMRLYLLCVGPLVIHLAAMLCGTIPLVVGVQSLVVLFAGTLASVAIGLTVALAPRQEAGGALSALIVAGAMFAFSLLTCAFAAARSYDYGLAAWSFLHPAGAFDAVMMQPTGLWRRMVFGAYGSEVPSPYTSAAPMCSVVASLLLTAMLLYSACRKLGAPERPLFGKRQAVTMFAFAAAALTLPALALHHAGSYFTESAIAGLSALIVWPLIVFGLFITPSGEAWTVALRRGVKTRWYADDAAPHRALWIMMTLWIALVTGLHGDFARAIVAPHGLRIAWLIVTAATLPCFVLFAATRYTSPAGRWAFGIGAAVHFICQVMAAGCVTDQGPERLAGVLVTVAAVAAVVVPGIVVWRQRALARALLAR